MQPTAPAIPVISLPVAGVETVLAVIIFIVFIWWAIYTIVVCYHWMRYARDSWAAIPAIALHLFVSGWIFVFSTGGLH